ncbi:hypothetical protein SASPL_146488 [Salvia splendens]|uniref:Uncharacterized protein n=1 Tax=Salvia splendens TaxID=180675 RepID=A0A8X8WDP8_SALSN|nr:hypothetical protein SASPL_146488 [Salvia splendens]
MPCRASSSSFRVCETRFRPPSSGGAPMETVSVTSARRCVASACLFSAVDPPLCRIEAAAPRRCCPPSSEPIEPPLPRTSGGGGPASRGSCRRCSQEVRLDTVRSVAAAARRGRLRSRLATALDTPPSDHYLSSSVSASGGTTSRPEPFSLRS